MKLNGVVTINYIINIYINYIIVLLLTLKRSMKLCLQLITLQKKVVFLYFKNQS